MASGEESEDAVTALGPINNTRVIIKTKQNIPRVFFTCDHVVNGAAWRPGLRGFDRGDVQCCSRALLWRGHRPRSRRVVKDTALFRLSDWLCLDWGGSE